MFGCGLRTPPFPIELNKNSRRNSNKVACKRTEPICLLAMFNSYITAVCSPYFPPQKTIVWIQTFGEDIWGSLSPDQYGSRLSGRLCCCVSFWFWPEIGFGCTYYYCTIQKKKFQSEKKASSHLSGRCAIVITTGKKSSSCLSGGCTIVITTGKKSYSRVFYAKLNVLNLNVTNFYQFQLKLI